MRFLDGLGSGSRPTTAIDADRPGTTVGATDLLPLFAAADVVTMDIDGRGWPVLANARLSTTGWHVLVMEYHRVRVPSSSRGRGPRAAQGRRFEAAT